MQIVVTARHGHLTPEHQKKIEEKVGKLLHYFSRVEAIGVTVDLENTRGFKNVEIQLNAEHKHDFVAKESHNDLMAAVDLAVTKMEAQMRKYKEKIQDHRRDHTKGDSLGAPTL